MATSTEVVTPMDLGEGSLDLDTPKEYKSFPPVSDTVDFIKQVDWKEVRQKCRAGFNNCGLVVAIIGEKIHDLGSWMANV